MAEKTCQVGAIVFETLGVPTTGKTYLLDWTPPEAQMKRIDYHINGVDGQLTNNLGRINFKLRISVRYVSADPWAAFVTHRDAWLGTALTIIGADGKTYNRCYLDGHHQTRKPTATGRAGGQQFADYMLMFTCNGSVV